MPGQDDVLEQIYQKEDKSILESGDFTIKNSHSQTQTGAPGHDHSSAASSSKQRLQSENQSHNMHNLQRMYIQSHVTTVWCPAPP